MKNLTSTFYLSFLCHRIGKYVVFTCLCLACLGLPATAQVRSYGKKKLSTDRVQTTGPLLKRVRKSQQTAPVQQRLSLLKSKSLNDFKSLQLVPHQAQKAFTKANADLPLQMCATLPDGYSITMTAIPELYENRPDLYSPNGFLNMYYDGEGNWRFEDFEDWESGYGFYTYSSTATTPPTGEWNDGGESYIPGNLTVTAGACPTRPLQEFCVKLPDGLSVKMTEAEEPYYGKPDFYSPLRRFNMYYYDETKNWEFGEWSCSCGIPVSFSGEYGFWTNSSTATTPPSGEWEPDPENSIQESVTVTAGTCPALQQVCVTLPNGNEVTLIDIGEPSAGAPILGYFLSEDVFSLMFRFNIKDGSPPSDAISVSPKKNASMDTQADEPEIGWLFYYASIDQYFGFTNSSTITTPPTDDQWMEIEGDDNITVKLGPCSSCNVPLGAANVQVGTLSNSACQVTITATASGRAFVFTGPDGYVFSNVFRLCDIQTIRADKITKPGTYTLTIYGKDELDKVTIPIQVTGAGCP